MDIFKKALLLSTTFLCLANQANGMKDEKDNNDFEFNISKVSYKDKTSKNEKEKLKYFQKKSKRGDIKAKYNLGVIHYYGRGTSKDEEKAVGYFQEAADLGDIKATYNLGVMHFYGIGTPKDEKNAVGCFQKAADQEDMRALYSLGVLYFYGKYIPEDKEKAADCFQKAAKKGHAKALLKLKEIYKTKEIFKGFKPKDPKALYKRGKMYEKGEGVTKNLNKANKLYELVGEGINEYVKATYKRAKMYEKGEGVPQDQKKAQELYKLVGEGKNGYAKAKYRRARMCEKGEGLPGGQDVNFTAFAVYLYESAYEKGHAKSLISLQNLVNSYAPSFWDFFCCYSPPKWYQEAKEFISSATKKPGDGNMNDYNTKPQPVESKNNSSQSSSKEEDEITKEKIDQQKKIMEENEDIQSVIQDNAKEFGIDLKPKKSNLYDS